MIDHVSLRPGKQLNGNGTSSQNLERLPKRREKGLWNFLTWSFFISQVLAVEQALGSAAKISDSSDDSASAGDAAQGQRALAGR